MVIKAELNQDEYLEFVLNNWSNAMKVDSNDKKNVILWCVDEIRKLKGDKNG